MEFRPCIDIHNGKVKQIVGSSLKDEGDSAKENFVSERNADFYAEFYRDKNLKKGHVILLNSADSEYYNATKQQALLALKTFPGGLQVGGGIRPENAKEFIDAGACHVIVTSYVFSNGDINFQHIDEMVEAVGKEHLVLDLSCRKKGDDYYVVTDRWQKFTNEKVTIEFLERLSQYCDEFLIHAVDVEGKSKGIEVPLVELLAGFEKIPVTYAGGIGDIETLRLLKEKGGNRINATIGSAMDLFGGPLSLDEVLKEIG